MAEPQIRYAKTADNVSIAYWTLGEGGMPLVIPPSFAFTHVKMEWEIPEIRSWYEQLAARRQIVRFDSRGTGLSDRHASIGSLDALVDDMETVADRCSLERFAVMGVFNGGVIAMSYAIRCANRVSQLVLWC